MSENDPGDGGREPSPLTNYSSHSTSYPSFTAEDAEKKAMCRLQAALRARGEHTERADAWDCAVDRNHFGPSIAKAMELGRKRRDTDDG